MNTRDTQTFWQAFSCEKMKGDEIAISWLGQSGFLFKNPKGTVLAIDPYLTDCVERIWGFKRLMASVCAPQEFHPDILVATHFHEDHLDMDAIAPIITNKKTLLLTPQSCMERLQDLGSPLGQVRAFARGDRMEHKDIILEAVFADHGDMVPDPIGVLVTMNQIKIYFCSDTAYTPEKMKRAIEFRPDIIIPPINGANGNLNATEAVRLALDCSAKAVIPCHFWMFAEHLGSPQEFKNEMEKHALEMKPIMICQAEIVKYGRER